MDVSLLSEAEDFNEDVQGCPPSRWSIASDPEFPVMSTPNCKETGKPREAVGRLRVMCHSATNLAAGDIALFSRSSDPYAQVQLRDTACGQASGAKRTRYLPKTLNPQWMEDFWFSFKKSPEHLVMNVAVYDYDEGKDDDFLGEANLQLSQKLLSAATKSPHVVELPLLPNTELGATQVQGSVRVEVTWLPSMHFGDGSIAMLRTMMGLLSSHQALRVLRVGLMGTAGLLMVVASQAEWLCEGEDIARCQPVLLPGTSTACMVGGLAALFGTCVHFASSVGLCGRQEPLHLWDLADTDFDHGSDGLGNRSPAITLQVQPTEAFVWQISMDMKLMPKVNLQVVYMLNFWLHLTATGLGSLALFFGFLHCDDRRFFAEGWYLDLSALLCLFGTALTSVREGRLLAKEERERWLHTPTPVSRRPTEVRSLFNPPFPGGIPLEEFSAKAQELSKQLHKSVKDGIDDLRKSAPQAQELSKQLQRSVKDGIDDLRKSALMATHSPAMTVPATSSLLGGHTGSPRPSPGFAGSPYQSEGNNRNETDIEGDAKAGGSTYWSCAKVYVPSCG